MQLEINITQEKTFPKYDEIYVSGKIKINNIERDLFIYKPHATGTYEILIQYKKKPKRFKTPYRFKESYYNRKIINWICQNKGKL